MSDSELNQTNSSLERPGKTGGMRHVALFVKDFEACESFYTDLLGMQVEWKPDPDNTYLTSGNDNLALHRMPTSTVERGGENQGKPDISQQRLDHIGFIIDAMDDVDRWHEFLKAKGVRIKAQPRTHRDGARSFYCLDPDGTLVQLIYHPPISGR